MISYLAAVTVGDMSLEVFRGRESSGALVTFERTGMVLLVTAEFESVSHMIYVLDDLVHLLEIPRPREWFVAMGARILNRCNYCWVAPWVPDKAGSLASATACWAFFCHQKYAKRLRERLPFSAKT
jgi:hypothetical protein